MEYGIGPVLLKRAWRASRFIPVLALSTALAACSGGTGSTINGSTFGNLLAFNSLKAPPLPATAAKAEIDVDCPEVTILEGAAALRTFAGADQSNANLRHQFSMGELARECRVENNQLKIKVGVSGYVLAGPAGSAGSFTVPVRIAVRRDVDQKILVSELYRAPAALQANESQTTFIVVSEPLSVPFTRRDSDEEYSIIVGFDQAGGAVKPAKPTPRKQR